MAKELVIYIHGISADEGGKPAAESTGEELQADRARRGHAAEYRELREGSGKSLSGADRERWGEAATHCYIEWGWEHEESDASNLGRSHRLSDAQNYLGRRVLDEIVGDRRLSLSPLRRIRALSLYGLSDVFYYVSSDGSRSVRARISQQIAKAVGDLLNDPTEQVDLTVIGHSAGSVIALDLVTSLFGGGAAPAEASRREPSVSGPPDWSGRESSEAGMPFGFTKMDAVERDTSEARWRIEALEQAAVQGRLVLRLLCTMGSPISMLAFRSDDAIRQIAYGGRLSLAELGITGRGSHSGGARWINIWDRRDPISFPVEPMVEESPLVEDHRVSTSWNPLASHTGYWRSSKVHRLLADRWSRFGRE